MHIRTVQEKQQHRDTQTQCQYSQQYNRYSIEIFHQLLPYGGIFEVFDKSVNAIIDAIGNLLQVTGIAHL